jgi:hypothetical protein
MRGFWARGTDCIVDVRVTDTDAKSFRHGDPAKVMATKERRNKNTLRPASSNSITSPLLFAPPMVCSVVKHLP